MDPRESERRMAKMERELEALRRHVANLPARWPQPPPSTEVAVQITAAAIGGGQYVGKILNGASTVDGTDITLPLLAGMAAPPQPDAFIINAPETGSLGHALATDGSAWGLGKLVGSIADGPYKGKQIVLIGGALGGSASPIVRMVVTTGPSNTNPRLVGATPVTGGDEVDVRCVVGHGQDDILYAYQPVGGTDQPSAAWMEVGVDGQEFQVDLTLPASGAGTGTLASPYNYIPSVSGSDLWNATPATRSGKGLSLSAWAPVLGTVAVAAKFGRARFMPNGNLELVDAFETFAPLQPVLLDHSSSPPPIVSGGSSPASVTYTVNDISTNEVLATNATPLNRNLGPNIYITKRGTFGFGYFDIQGGFSLVAAVDEEWKTKSCS